jgi:TolB-like protein/DNA-binding winged helix-turn-helix (wHTH) protein/Tfp pilus assembly protein PilF
MTAARDDAAPVDLTRTPDFTLGTARIRPAHSEVGVHGRIVRLQPRVMQVLVALARAQGEVVSRDDLVISCWSGRVVGDDSINRCIQRLRRLVESDAPDSFVISTLPRIGYRLIAGGASEPPLLANAAALQTRPDRRGGALTLAVMPFANRSGLREDEVFAFGMADDLIEAMSLGLDLRVVSSSALVRFRKDGVADFEALRRELGVAYVLEGNVRRDESKLQVTAQLVDIQTGAIVWTRLFERPLERLAALQNDLVLEVAAHLRAHARKLELIRALRKPGDLTAYEAAMRSAAAFRRVTGPALFLAAAEARRAVEIDPHYGLALAYLSLAEAILYYSLKADDDSEAERIRALAERALTLEPDRSSVIGIAAQALLSLGFPEEGFAAAERAVQINPNNETAHMALGMACAFLGRLDEALAHFDREQAVAPNHPTTLASLMWRATAHARGENWQFARQTYDQALRLAPDEAGARVGRAMIFAVMGRDEEARVDLARARKLDPATPLEIWDLRFRRGYAHSAVQDLLLGHLRDLWART